MANYISDKNLKKDTQVKNEKYPVSENKLLKYNSATHLDISHTIPTRICIYINFPLHLSSQGRYEDAPRRNNSFVLKNVIAESASEF